MPNVFRDQFWEIDTYNNEPAVGTPLGVQSLEVIDTTDNGQIGEGQDDTIDGSSISASFAREIIRVQLANDSEVSIEGWVFSLADGRVLFTPTDGSILEDGATYVSSLSGTSREPIPVADLGPACFASGTIFRTASGPVNVEDLSEGDAVINVDGHNVRLRKILKREIGDQELQQNTKLQPVRIVAGALGNNLPERDLLVSRQHRMLVRSSIAQSMFGTSEVLISAIKLTELPGIFVDTSVSEITYFHLIFDKHEVIFAEGAPTESLLLGPMAREALGEEVVKEIRAIFPDAFDDAPEPAYLIPTNKQQKQFVGCYMN